MREATVAASWPEALLNFAACRGANRAEMMRRASLQPQDLLDPTARVPLLRYVELLDAAIELCGDPGLALKFGEEVSIDKLSIVALIAANADNPSDTQAKINRYGSLMLDDGSDNGASAFTIVHRDGKVWIKLGSAVYARYPAVTEAGIARVVCGARDIFEAHVQKGAAPRFPEAIHFQYPEPSHRKEYDRVFGVPLVFDSDMTAIGVDSMVLTMSMPKQYGAAAAAVTVQAEQLLARLESDASTRASVEKELARNLEKGDVRMETIARKMGLSRATLFRKLKAENATFDDVLQSLRRERALQLLNDEKRSVQQTAHLLGFSDPAAFSRAFKRWTGVSPKAARAV